MRRIIEKVQFMPKMPKPKNVAAYARVSSDKEAMIHSIKAQIDYYKNLITKHPGWKFCGVYADEGISGTKDNRDEFLKLVDRCRNGEIDLIITKSISRFARNTVDSLSTIRKLKEHGVECYFEKENIWTFDSKGELLITIMSSLAQEEIRSISENVKWGRRKSFSDGKVSLPYKNFLGFKKGDDGLPEIVPEEAEVVRYIYRQFLSGKTAYKIAIDLTNKGIPTPAGYKEWRANVIKSILTNEKYKGAALLQKCYVSDFLTKKLVPNMGEVPQYYVEHSHEPIIPPEEFEEVQLEIQRRSGIDRYSGNSVFSSRLVCADCGSFFGSKVLHSNSKYRRIIWQCNNKFKGKHFCETPHMYEDDIKQRFIQAFNEAFSDTDTTVFSCKCAADELSDTSEIDEKIEKTKAKLSSLAEKIKRQIKESAMAADSDDEAYNRLTEEFQKNEEKLNRLEKSRQEQLNRAESMRVFVKAIEENPILDNFDEELFSIVVDKVVDGVDGKLTFRLY